MNVLEGLNTIRDRLDENGANPATISLVDAMRKRAAVPAAQAASAQSLLQLVRMLIRTPVADANAAVYNDLLRLEDQLQVRAAEFQERKAAKDAEDAKPLPKLKKYYKEQKEREREQAKKASGT